MPMDQFSSSEGFWWAQVREPIMDPAPKILSSAYKSVIPQHNALWGAQFYEAEATSTTEPPEAEAAAAAAAMFRAPHGTLNFHPYREDTAHTYDEEDTDEQIMEERDNIEAVYREDDHQEQGRAEEEREHMFEKPLTPSDVGKLNRLVIPKQHAERYFPLGGAGGSGSGSGNGGGESSGGGEKGLLLSFEDESGKGWRFRYSYWNSSQSYVLTKGWSRFVKEKRLDAGDVVLFERHRINGERFYIRWRRRAIPVQDSPAAAAVLPLPQQHEGPPLMGSWTRILYSGPAGPTPLPPPPSSHHQYHHHHHQYYQAHHSHGSPLLPPPPLLYQADFLHADITTPRGALAPVVQNPTAPGNWKRLRLFGVNLECQMLDDDEGPPQAYPSPISEEAASSPSGHHFSPSLVQPDQSVHGSSLFVTAHNTEQEDTLSFQRDINRHTRNIPCRPDLSM